MCQSVSRWDLSSSTTMHLLYIAINLLSVKCTKHPALHKSETDKSDSDRSLSRKIYAVSGFGKFGRRRDPTLCAWMHAPLGNWTLSVSGLISVIIPLSDCLRIVWVDPVSTQARAKAVKLASVFDSFVLITMAESTTCTNFTAVS